MYIYEVFKPYEIEVLYVFNNGIKAVMFTGKDYKVISTENNYYPKTNIFPNQIIFTENNNIKVIFSDTSQELNGEIFYLFYIYGSRTSELKSINDLDFKYFKISSDEFKSILNIRKERID